MASCALEHQAAPLLGPDPDALAGLPVFPLIPRLKKDVTVSAPLTPRVLSSFPAGQRRLCPQLGVSRVLYFN